MFPGLSKRSAVLAIMAMLSYPGRAFAVFDTEVAVGYTGLAYQDNGSSASAGALPDNNFKGLALQSAFHIDYAIKDLLSLGLGPYFVGAPGMTYSGQISGNSYTNTYFTFGGELKARLLMVPVVVPYVKAGVGYDKIHASMSTGISSQSALRMSGVSYRAMLGFEFSLSSIVYIFAEGGISVAQYNATIFGNTGYKTSALGYLTNIGVGLHL